MTPVYTQVQQKDVSDEDVARAINQKLGDTPGVSYSDIAARAYGCGRAELAIKVWLCYLSQTPQGRCSRSLSLPSHPSQLLEYEPRSGEQVPLLLKMKRSKLALSKAIESGDTDLGEQGWARARRHEGDEVSEPRNVQSWAGGPPTSSSHSVYSAAAPEE